MSLIAFLGLVFALCCAVTLFEVGKILRLVKHTLYGQWVIKLVLLSTTVVVVGLSVVLINVLIMSESHANLKVSQHSTYTMEDTD